MPRPRRPRTREPRPNRSLARPPLAIASLAAIVTSVFEELDVGAAFHSHETATVYGEWYPLHSGPSFITFEVPYGTAPARWRYNGVNTERAHQERRVILGAHAGLHDFFVPAGRSADGAPVTLVVGPFATARPSSGELLEGWRSMSGNIGRLSDSGFARFVALRMRMLTLSAAEVRDLEGLLECLARIAERGADTAALANPVRELRLRLLRTRAVEQMWDGGRSMIDARTARGWLDCDRTQELLRLGVTRPPEHVVVGLLRAKTDTRDRLDDLLARDAFQRACTELAIKRGRSVCARVGNHGVALLVEESAPERAGRSKSSQGRRRTGLERLPSRLVELTDAATGLARRFGFLLHFGVSAREPAMSPSEGYRAALAAAEEALSKGSRVVHADPRRVPGPRGLGPARRQLARIVREEPNRLSDGFQSYVEQVTLRHGYRLDPVRADLAAGFDQVIMALESSGVMDDKDLVELERDLETAASEADTVSDVEGAYVRAIADVQQALHKPTEAHRERGFRRAIAYVREHAGEDLTRRKVARIAGFGEQYFSKRFTDSEGTSFKEYVQRLRIERAKQLLLSTKLSVERVGQLCGFPTRAQFHKVFRRTLGRTPSDFRDSQ